jgi:ABC-type phosphate/phosphonate transport system ATPase subunit
LARETEVLGENLPSTTLSTTNQKKVSICQFFYASKQLILETPVAINVGLL